MSISALADEAGRLLQVFQGAESTINAAVSNAKNVAVEMERSYWVDPIAGNDSNPGTSNNPFETIKKCVEVAPKNATVIAYLACGCDHTVSGLINVYKRSVTINGGIWNPRNVDDQTGDGRARIVNISTADGSGRNNSTTGFAKLHSGSAINFYQCKILTAENETTPADGDSPYRGLIRRSDEAGFVICKLRECHIELRDSPLARIGTNAPHFSFVVGLTEIVRSSPETPDQPLIFLEGGSMGEFTATAMTIPSGSDWDDDLIGYGIAGGFTQWVKY